MDSNEKGIDLGFGCQISYISWIIVPPSISRSWFGIWCPKYPKKCWVCCLPIWDMTNSSIKKQGRFDHLNSNFVEVISGLSALHSRNRTAGTPKWNFKVQMFFIVFPFHMGDVQVPVVSIYILFKKCIFWYLKKRGLDKFPSRKLQPPAKGISKQVI